MSLKLRDRVDAIPLLYIGSRSPVNRNFKLIIFSVGAHSKTASNVWTPLSKLNRNLLALDRLCLILNSEVWILVLVLDQSAFSAAKRARWFRNDFVQLV